MKKIECTCKSKCNHNSINWKFSQFNPDYGICYNCGKQVAAWGPSSAIHEQGCDIFNAIIASIEP